MRKGRGNVCMHAFSLAKPEHKLYTAISYIQIAMLLTINLHVDIKLPVLFPTDTVMQPLYTSMTCDSSQQQLVINLFRCQQYFYTV